jgi:hypothetical protein
MFILNRPKHYPTKTLQILHPFIVHSERLFPSFPLLSIRAFLAINHNSLSIRHFHRIIIAPFCMLMNPQLYSITLAPPSSNVKKIKTYYTCLHHPSPPSFPAPHSPAISSPLPPRVRSRVLTSGHFPAARHSFETHCVLRCALRVGGACRLSSGEMMLVGRVTCVEEGKVEGANLGRLSVLSGEGADMLLTPYSFTFSDPLFCNSSR